MPITRRQFDLGISEAVEGCMERIHAFLSEEQSKAFSKEEIFAALAGQVALKTFDQALDKLAQIRAVDVRHVRGKPYYAYLQDLERVW